MAEISTGKKSFLGMFLSLICPGLGQVYLHKPLKGIALFFGAAIGFLLLYVNSLPVDSINDLFLIKIRNQEDADSRFNFELQLKNPESENYEYTIRKFKKGELRFRPFWQFRLSGSIQMYLLWLYAIWDGFLGYKGYKRKKEIEVEQSKKETNESFYGFDNKK